MHSPLAGALHSRGHYCILRVHELPGKHVTNVLFLVTDFSQANALKLVSKILHLLLIVTVLH